MGERSNNIILDIAKSCVACADNCPDYGTGNGKKVSDMALNFFLGAADLAKLQGNDELSNQIAKIAIFMISVGGMKRVRELVEKAG